MRFIDFLIRILGAIADAFNRKKKKEYADNPSDAISNGGRVYKSDKSFTDLADKPNGDSAK